MVQKYNSYKVLVVGSTGMLGENYIRMSSTFFNIIPTSSTNRNYEKLDITNSSDVSSIIMKHNPDIIINCSAYTAVDSAEKNKKEAYEINVVGLKNLIKHSLKNTKIIHISSDYVFDGITGDYNEDSLPNPLNYYGRTKLESENVLIGSLRNSLIFRINGLFDFNNKNFLTWVYDNLKNKNSINVVDDQYSNPVFAETFVNVINHSIALDLTGLYHYGSKDKISRYEFALGIASHYNLDQTLIKPISTHELKQLADRPLNTNLICDKIKNTLDIELETLTTVFNDNEVKSE